MSSSNNGGAKDDTSRMASPSPTNTLPPPNPSGRQKLGSLSQQESRESSASGDHTTVARLSHPALTAAAASAVAGAPSQARSAPHMDDLDDDAELPPYRPLRPAAGVGGVGGGGVGVSVGLGGGGCCQPLRQQSHDLADSFQSSRESLRSTERATPPPPSNQLCYPHHAHHRQLRTSVGGAGGGGGGVIRQISEPETCIHMCPSPHHGSDTSFHVRHISHSPQTGYPSGDPIASIAADTLRINGALRQFKQVLLNLHCYEC